MYSLVLTLMVIAILNLALTVWLLKVMGFSSVSSYLSRSPIRDLRPSNLCAMIVSHFGHEWFKPKFDLVI